MEALVTIETAELESLHRKLDYLTEQFEQQRRHQEELNELKQDMIPIFNHMFKLTIEELAEVGDDFQVEDIVFLTKRLLRDIPMLISILDQAEGLMAFGEEAGLLTKPVFNSMVETLDQMEHAGYFAFLRGLMYVGEKIMTEFGEQDVRDLGDNVVTILTTVRNMTQPEIMNLANSMIDSISQPDKVDENVSTWKLLREMGDPKVRKGLSRMLNMVKALADQPETNGSS